MACRRQPRRHRLGPYAMGCKDREHVRSRNPVSENELPIEIGQIEAVFRYPVKSMRGEPLDGATLGWPGLDRGPEGEVR
jgi:hypothetical protein